MSKAEKQYRLGCRIEDLAYKLFGRLPTSADGRSKNSVSAWDMAEILDLCKEALPQADPTKKTATPAPSPVADPSCKTCNGKGTYPKKIYGKKIYGSGFIDKKCDDCDGTGRAS